MIDVQLPGSIALIRRHRRGRERIGDDPGLGLKRRHQSGQSIRSHPVPDGGKTERRHGQSIGTEHRNPDSDHLLNDPSFIQHEAIPAGSLDQPRQLFRPEPLEVA